ncbi:MAG TPA: MaoC family dehydratase N-terminal domain-containing protein [Acidimicrobiales bacterium]|nr:MaoC family dehydratase N-terminal domain-containing protein [Acidimicrobiales bacterium]
MSPPPPPAPPEPGTGTLPADVVAMIGVPLYEEEGEFPVERGYVWSMCAAVENGNPLYWDEATADAITGGPIAPPTMLSVWFRPHHWAPGRDRERLPLQIHFDLKERLGLPEAVMTDNTMTFYDPVRPGDVLRTRQILRSVSDPKTTKLGTGRFWVIEVDYANQRGERVGVESYTGFGYRRPGPHGGAAPAPPGRES